MIDFLHHVEVEIDLASQIFFYIEMAMYKT